MNGDPIRLRWLRPVAIGMAVSLHAGAAFWLSLPSPPKIAAAESLDLTIAQGQPEPPAPEPPAPEPPPPEPPPPEPPKPEPPPPPPVPPPQAPPPPVAPPAPKREVADAPAFAKPKVQPKPPEPPPPPNLPPPDPNAPGEQAARDLKTAAIATYGQKVLTEIRSHRRPQRRTGSVVVSFSINAEGVVTEASVLRSCGKDELDEAALQMVRDSRPGAPPDGHFSGSTTINFLDK